MSQTALSTYLLAPPKSSYEARRQAELTNENIDPDFVSRDAFNRKHGAHSVPTLDDDSDDIPWCSAKSMYRLCDSTLILPLWFF
jgi:glutathione S-transferase